MDHVIRTLKNWLEIYEDSNDDKKAIRCIKNALKELKKYYD